MRSSASAWRASSLLFALALASCNPPCVEVSTDCDPLYEPTFDNVYEQTLKGSCALSGCHEGDHPAEGLDLSGADTAYDALMDGRVDPGDVDCSILIRRLETDNNHAMMPPGDKLSEEERCAIRQWVDAGAQR